MTEHSELRDGEVVTAEVRLEHLNVQVTAMRAVLLQLLQDVARTETRLENGRVDPPGGQLVLGASGAALLDVLAQLGQAKR